MTMQWKSLTRQPMGGPEPPGRAPREAKRHYEAQVLRMCRTRRRNRIAVHLISLARGSDLVLDAVLGLAGRFELMIDVESGQAEDQRYCLSICQVPGTRLVEGHGLFQR